MRGQSCQLSLNTKSLARVKFEMKVRVSRIRLFNLNFRYMATRKQTDRHMRLAMQSC